jgi:cyclic-di-GMP-binding protein
MASSYSFDIVSDFDRQELVNTLDQTNREIGSRYDLKDTQTTVELSEDKIVINTASDMTLDAVRDMLQAKAVKRNLSLKIFDYGQVESASGNRVRQEVTLKKGIAQEHGFVTNLRRFKHRFKGRSSASLLKIKTNCNR